MHPWHRVGPFIGHAVMPMQGFKELLLQPFGGALSLEKQVS